MEVLIVLSIAFWLSLSRKPTTVTDDRIGRLGEVCDNCGFDRTDGHDETAECWYYAP